MPLDPPQKPLPPKDPFFGLRILQPNEDPSLPPKRILNYKDGTELVYVPPGPFWMGDGKAADRPRHEVTLDGFYMAVYPVTNKQYRRFIHETGHRAPEGSAWEMYGEIREGMGSQQLPEYEEHPVTCVNWDDASAYGAWAKLRLPTEAEWEKAAGGPLNTLYPWGNDWEEGRCRCSENRGAETTAEVKAYTAGVSGYGCEQMTGNVNELCSDWYGEDYYLESPRRNPWGPEGGSYRVGRGGSWWLRRTFGQVSVRNTWSPGARSDVLGFRLARSFP